MIKTRGAVMVLASIASFGASAAIPRFPQPYGDRIVFVADGTLWSASKTGGTAIRLTSTPGQDMMPRVSPDGRWIAYTEATKAGTDIWVIPASGGAARRLTYHPTTEAGTGGRHGPDNMVVTWTPDSSSVLYLSKRNQWNSWVQELWSVSVSGGAPSPMPIDSAVGLATYAPDGHTIAYNRIFRNFRTWKRYNGGLAQQVFTYDFNTKALAQITHWSGTNTSPMWYGRHIYYLSDQDANRRANIWCYDLDTKQSRQITHFADYDIDFPGLGGNAIAFQKGGKLYRMDLPDEHVSEVPIAVPDDEIRTRPRVTDVKDQLRTSDPAGQIDFALAPNGKRTLFSARGDIFSVPTEHGATRDLTGSPGVDEDHPAWSADGKWLAYTTDSDGNQQVAIRPAEGGVERRLTHFNSGYLYGPVFSPDGRMLAFSDGSHALWIVRTDGTPPRRVAQDKFQEIHDQAFSPDGRWIAYSLTANDRRRDIYLYEIGSGRTTRLGNGMEIDYAPTWSPDGRFLYFLSNRHETTLMSDIEFDFAAVKTAGIYAVPLSKEIHSPVEPRSDEADSGSERDAKRAPSDDPKGQVGRVRRKADDPQPPDRASVLTPIHIDLDGMMARAVALPIEPSNIAQIDARGKRIFYLTQPISMVDGPLKGETSGLHFFDLETGGSELVADDVDNYSISLDGEKILIHHDKTFTVIDAKKDAKKDEDSKKILDLDHMRLLVDPRAEWTEMYENAWRLQRDMFFSKVMNGQDWQAVHDSYAKLVPLIGSREDLNYVIGQVNGEIGNSHTYVGGGDDGETGTGVHPALLGVDWAVDTASGRYRIATIYPGDNTRSDYRSPLSQPGLGVRAGDYVLAINGYGLRAPTDPDALLQLSDPETPVELSISDSPSGATRTVMVKPIDKELPLREAAWIARNRSIVDRLSDGRVGYVYLSDMEALGLQQFMRQFYGQLGKQALIMDDRWNGGGFIAPYALERLRRTLATLDVNRQGGVSSEPNQVMNGPKVALLNHWSASDGDIFPDLFRRYGLGPLVGTRSWGGVRGIRGNWSLMDGGYITIPEEAPYGLDGKWIVENHGVDPDVEVEDDPADLLNGHDRQLETAVSMMLKAIKDRPSGLPVPPALVPAYPESGIVAPQ